MWAGVAGGLACGRLGLACGLLLAWPVAKKAYERPTRARRVFF